MNNASLRRPPLSSCPHPSPARPSICIAPWCHCLRFNLTHTLHHIPQILNGHGHSHGHGTGLFWLGGQHRHWHRGYILWLQLGRVLRAGGRIHKIQRGHLKRPLVRMLWPPSIFSLNLKYTNQLWSVNSNSDELPLHLQVPIPLQSS